MGFWNMLLHTLLCIALCFASLKYGLALSDKYHTDERERIHDGYYTPRHAKQASENVLPATFDPTLRSTGQATCKLR